MYSKGLSEILIGFEKKRANFGNGSYHTFTSQGLNQQVPSIQLNTGCIELVKSTVQ